MKLVARRDYDLELSGREEPREAAQLAAVRSHVDVRDGDPSFLFGRIRGDGRETTAVANRADRIPRTLGCGVYGSGNTRALGNRQNLIRPVLLVVVGDIARSQRGDRRATVRARGRDYLRPAERPERHQQATGHAAGAIHKKAIAGTDTQRLIENLRGGKRRHRKDRSSLPRDTGRLAGDQRRRSNQRGRPGSLVSQRERM